MLPLVYTYIHYCTELSDFVMGGKADFFFTNIDEKDVFNMDWLNHALPHLLDEVSSCANINIVDQFSVI